MIEIPQGIQTFVLVGIALLVVIIPIKVIWEMTRGMRTRLRRFEDLAQRVRERFAEVRVDRSFLGPERIRFTHEGRAASLVQTEPDTLALRLEPKISPKAHVLLRTRGRISWPFTLLWESLRVLPRIRMFDPMLDEGIEVFASDLFGAYLRELAQQGLPAGEKPSGLAESLVVLRRLPGVDRFELRMSPSGGFRVFFRLRSEDLLYRPDELESAVHHAFRLYDLLVLY